MILYYLDTSGWVKRYYHEAGTTWVTDLFAQAVDRASSTLGLVELTASLARKVKAGELDPSALQSALDQAERDWADFFRMHLLPEVVGRATRVARDRAVRGADAVHLASAIVLRQKLVAGEDVMFFVTSDRELKAAAEREGFETIDPEAEEAATNP